MQMQQMRKNCRYLGDMVRYLKKKRSRVPAGYGGGRNRWRKERDVFEREKNLQRDKGA